MIPGATCHAGCIGGRGTWNMAHRYGQPIEVATNAAGEPTALRWRGRDYHILRILSRWRLRERRWDAIGGAANSAAAAGEERYYRLACDGELLCEVYHDAARDRWVLDRVLD